MIGDDTMDVDRIESLTHRHLREFRRTQDLLLDLVKRQTEITGRLALELSEFKLETVKNFTELRSDVILLENRSITAAENDEFFRRKLAAIEDELGSVKDELGSVVNRLGSVGDVLGSVENGLGSLDNRLGSMQVSFARIESTLTRR